MRPTAAGSEDEPAGGPAAGPLGEPGYFHAVAVDYDGTLTDGNSPCPDTLAALAESRAEGRLAVLVTGRILSELRGVFPDVDGCFDLIDLCAEALLGVDLLVALPGGRDVERTVDLVAAAGTMAHTRARHLVRSAGAGHGVLVDRNRPGTGIVFAVGDRNTGHLRHWHKYAAGGLAPERRFYFRRGWDNPTGATAGSIEELEHELRTCGEDVIAHHSRHEDFSRWITEVLGDPPLGAQVAAIEATLRADETTPTKAREALVEAIHQRHPG